MKTHRIAVRDRRLLGVPVSIVAGSFGADVFDLDLDEEFASYGDVAVYVYPLSGDWDGKQSTYDGRPFSLPVEAYDGEGWIGLTIAASNSAEDMLMTVEEPHAIRVLPSFTASKALR